MKDERAQLGLQLRRHGDGRRNEVHYIYDGNVVIQERDGNNLPATTYTRGRDLSGSLQGAGGIGGMLARTDNHLSTINSPLSTSFYHADGNGNITALVDAQQYLVAKYVKGSVNEIVMFHRMIGNWRSPRSTV